MKFRHETLEDDMVYRDHVLENEREYVNDFLGPFSKDILQYVGKYFMIVQPSVVYNQVNKSYYEDYASPMKSDFYMFIAKPFFVGDDNVNMSNPIPQWNNLRKYEAKNNCKLHSFVYTITFREFYKRAKTLQKSPDVGTVFTEEVFNFFEQLFYDQDVSSDDFGAEIQTDLRNALTDLRNINTNTVNEDNVRYKFDGEKDYRVLELCIMYEYDWEDVADELRDYFKKPFSGPLSEIPTEEKKDIQSRIAQWKKIYLLIIVLIYLLLVKKIMILLKLN